MDAAFLCQEAGRPPSPGFSAVSLCPFTAGGYEDPVTGSLNAGLAQWLIGTGVAPSTYVVSQGTAMGRMGRVHVERDGPETWIGGAVTTCITGALSL
jgi:predicted PhzF superfamily epimerase YddE/YHI9